MLRLLCSCRNFDFFHAGAAILVLFVVFFGGGWIFMSAFFAWNALFEEQGVSCVSVTVCGGEKDESKSAVRMRRYVQKLLFSPAATLALWGRIGAESVWGGDCAASASAEGRCAEEVEAKMPFVCASQLLGQLYLFVCVSLSSFFVAEGARGSVYFYSVSVGDAIVVSPCRRAGSLFLSKISVSVVWSRVCVSVMVSLAVLCAHWMKKTHPATERRREAQHLSSAESTVKQTVWVLSGIKKGLLSEWLWVWLCLLCRQSVSLAWNLWERNSFFFIICSSIAWEKDDVCLCIVRTCTRAAQKRKQRQNRCECCANVQEKEAWLQSDWVRRCCICRFWWWGCL